MENYLRKKCLENMACSMFDKKIKYENKYEVPKSKCLLTVF